MQQVQVSVIIPTYNSVKYVIAATESVLAQTFKDFEIIVVDDGSTDETESVLSLYQNKIRYIRQPNNGVAVARNRGIAESRGKYVAFLDADDTWLPNKLERQMNAMRQQTQYQACYSAFTVVDSDLNPLGISRSRRHGKALEDLLTCGNIIGSICTVICVRSLFEKVGAFDPALSQCADWDMWVRLAAQTEFLYLDEPLVTYRQHGTNMSRDASLLEHDSLRVLTKGFAMPELSAATKAKRQPAFARNYMVLAGTYFHAGRYQDFTRCMIKAIAMDVRQINYLAAFPVRRASRLRAGRLGAGT
jgi:glycosyltransferase involved in cell wall biosynthesis